VPGARSPAAGNFILSLDGVAVGRLRGVAGGAVTADVVVEPSGGAFPTKSLGPVRFEPVELMLDLPLPKAVADWVRQTWQGLDAVRDVSVVATDFSGKPISERRFSQAALDALTVPALDAASKDAGLVTLRAAPASTRTTKPAGQPVAAPATGRTQWVKANFRLAIDGLDASRVTKVDSFTTRRTPEGPGQLDVSNLRITLPEAHAQTWVAWHEALVVKGRRVRGERSGTLTFLAPNRSDSLGEIRFFNLGIFRVAPVPRAAGSDQIALLVAELYCERLELAI
jgi:hypothetical protein